MRRDIMTFAGLIAMGWLAGCQSAPTGSGGPGLSDVSSMVEIEGVEPSDAVDAADSTPLDWSKLEAMVIETARDRGKPVQRDAVRATAERFAQQINAVPPGEFRQHHLDRAALVLTREQTSGVLLAEGANLRGRGGVAGGSRSRSGSGRNRDVGRTGGSGGSSRSNSSTSTGSSFR